VSVACKNFEGLSSLITNSSQWTIGLMFAADPNSNPYGLMPDAPKIPEYATGLAARPGLGTALSRSSPLLAPRPISRALAGSTFGKPPARSRPRYCCFAIGFSKHCVQLVSSVCKHLSSNSMHSVSMSCWHNMLKINHLVNRSASLPARYSRAFAFRHA